MSAVRPSGERRRAISTIKRRARRIVGLVASIAVVGIGISGYVAPADADYATGGSGLYTNAIEWFTWGNYGDAIPNAGMTKTNTFVVGGETMDVTCTLGTITDTANKTGSYLTAYASGNYQGDGLDDLYNIGGTGTSNTLDAGLYTQNNDTVSFNFNCSATLNGANFPLAGMVMADAESTNNSEYIQATIPPSATWRIIDRYRNAADSTCASNSILGALNASNQLKLTSTNECTDGSPMVVAYMDGATSATNVTVHGSGREAIALGVFMAFDHGDAPASYGDAAHALQETFTGGTLASGSSGTRLSDPSFVLATPTNLTPRLGSSVDPDDHAYYSVNADGDDNSVTNPGGGDDEDSVTVPATITVLPGDTYTLNNVSCTGPGTVGAWIDWNENGVFDSGEAAPTQTCGSGTNTVDFSWTVPSDVASASHSYLRLRIGPDAASVASPTGVATSGEDEDYSFRMVVPQPVATDDTATTPYKTAVTLAPLSNDTAASGTTFDPSSVRLYNGSGWATSATTAGQGTYVVDAATGHVTFTPVAGFTGTATPVAYQVTDSLGRTAQANITPTVTPPPAPSASPDTDTTAYDTAVTTDVIGNDSAGDPSAPLQPATLRLVGPGSTLVTTLTTSDGTYVANSDGTITFTPTDGVQGVTAPVSYSIADEAHQTATSTYTVTIGAPASPVAANDSTSTPYNTAVSVDPLANDSAGPTRSPLDPASVRIMNGSTPVTSLTVAGQGTYVVDTATGHVTFTPVNGYIGTGTPVTYRMADGNGATATATITVTVSPPPPATTNDSASTQQGVPVVINPLSNDSPGSAGSPLDPTSVRLMNGSTPVTSLTVPGEGTYVVNTTTGDITFTPVSTFTGTSTPVTYRVTDGNGATATATIAVTVNAPPIANDDSTSTPFNTAVSVDPLANDGPGPSGSALDPTSVRLLNGSTPVTSLTVAGQGTYVVDTATGHVTFTPVNGYIGTGTPVTYRMADGNGATATATITVTVSPPPPATTNDSASTQQNVPVVINPLSNDSPGSAGSPLDPTSVRLMNGSTPVTSLTVPGEGTYVVNTTTGDITFTPVSTFTGTSTPVTYRVTDGNGATATATIAVTVNAPPIANDDSTSTPFNTAVSVDPLANDGPGPSGSALDPTSVRLLNGSTPVTSLTVAGQGTYVVDTATGHVTFTPVNGYIGTGTPVTYRVADGNGATATATITVSVIAPPPATTADSTSTQQGVPVVINPLSNDSPGAAGAPLDPTSVRLMNGSTPVTSLTVPGEGTYVVDPTTGDITFTPVPTFTGATTPVTYRVTDSNGATATATITVSTNPPPVANNDTASTPFNTAVTLNPLTNDTPGPSGVGARPDQRAVVERLDSGDQPDVRGRRHLLGRHHDRPRDVHSGQRFHRHCNGGDLPGRRRQRRGRHRDDLGHRHRPAARHHERLGVDPAERAGRDQPVEQRLARFGRAHRSTRPRCG